MATKKLVTRNTKTQVTAAIRKIWNTHPLKQAALTQACVNPGAKMHKRKFVCSNCLNEFLKQEVEVNHFIAAPKNETVDEFIKRIFCNIKSFKGDTCILTTGKEATIKSLAAKYLTVVCKECHKIITKEQNLERKVKKDCS